MGQRNISFDRGANKANILPPVHHPGLIDLYLTEMRYRVDELGSD